MVLFLNVTAEGDENGRGNAHLESRVSESPVTSNELTGHEWTGNE